MSRRSMCSLFPHVIPYTYTRTAHHFSHVERALLHSFTPPALITTWSPGALPGCSKLLVATLPYCPHQNGHSLAPIQWDVSEGLIAKSTSLFRHGGSLLTISGSPAACFCS